MDIAPIPGSKGTVCTLDGIFAADCSYGLFCEGSWRQVGNEGRCRCHRLFGLYGEQCTEQSTMTYVYVTLAFVVSIYALFVLCTSTAHAVAFYGGNPCRMFSTAGGRAILFSGMLPLAIFVSSFGSSLYVLQIGVNTVGMKLIALLANSLCALSIIGASLSVSVVWFQMAEKARVGGGSSQQLLTHPGFTVSAFAAAGLLLTLLMLASLGSLLFVVFFTGMLSFTYRIAGRRVTAVLGLVSMEGRGSDLSLAAQESRIIAGKVRETASFMSWGLAILSIVLLWCALSLPTQRPIYPRQNHLPRLYAGQIAVMASWTGMLYVDSHIIAYVKFWDARRASMKRRSRAPVVPDISPNEGGGPLALHGTSTRSSSSSSLVSGERSDIFLREIEVEMIPWAFGLSEIEEEASSQMNSSDLTASKPQNLSK